MLKYEIRRSEIASNTVEIPISSYEVNDNPENEELLMFKCYYDDDLDISTETGISVSSFYDIEYVTTNTRQTREIIANPEIIALNRDFRYLVFNLNKYISLKIKEIQIEEINGAAFLKFIFEDLHYFRTWDSEVNFYIVFTNQDGEVFEKTFDGCEVVDEYTLSWRYNKYSPDIAMFMCSIFQNDKYVFVGYEGNEKSVEVESVPASACFSDELYIKIQATGVGCENKYEYYEKECNEGSISGLNVYRDQLISDFTITADLARVKLHLPLSQMFDVTLQQEDNILSKFVYDEVRKSINGVVEMEKYVYHPAIIKEGREFKTEDVYEIKFNLHFRQHKGDTWSVDDNSYWNGVDNERVELESDMNSNIASDVCFFSYSDKSKQSDLLTYLGFTNSDVKFQKNKIKKSFLRLSFYDSDNSAKQNLLAYSTIYMDGGKLFSKFMNTSMTEGYAVSGSITEEDNNTYAVDNTNVGAKVNMEFAPEDYSNLYSDNELEEFRLSSQITVSDTYNSKSSSEGFYIYLWADNDNRNIPSDLYMKVEFNHAGFGRTIPFMMPFEETDTDSQKKIKSFEDIVSDWRNGNGYGIRKYIKYSYIHLKYRYDKEKERRVYYIDPDTYGNGVYYQGKNELVFNLYEAKVEFEKEGGQS